MLQDGLTLIELLMTLGIIALLTLLAAPSFHGVLARHQAQLDTESVVRALNLARQQALLRHETMTVCPNDLSGKCGEDWSLGILLINEQDAIISQQPFEHHAVIFLKTFPAGHEQFLQFGAQGDTLTQNGSFYYCPLKKDLAKRIVFNQAGRVYVTTDGAVEGCGS